MEHDIRFPFPQFFPNVFFKKNKESPSNDKRRIILQLHYGKICSDVILRIRVYLRL